MEVRKIALSRFGLRNLPDGAAVSDLRRVLVPIYLFHRYQIDAVAKLIGGTDFTYAVKGDGHEAAKAVEPMRQAAAMDALIGVLSPAALDLPDPLLDLLSSGQAQSPDPQNDIEIFSTEPVFDLPWASTVIAARVWSDLFAPARLDRLIEANRRDPAQPGLQVLLDKALKAVQPDPGQTGRQRELSRRVRHRLVVTLAADLATPAVSPTAAAIIRSRLTAYGHALAQMSAAKTSGSDFADQAQAKYLSSLLLEESGERLAALAAKGRAALPTPPGSPIGESDWFDDVSGAR
jgi:hypothetical protein